MSDPDCDGYASPACSLHEMDDAYLGYLTREQIIPPLAALQAAAHALAERGPESRRAAAARWDAALAAQLARLDAAPSSSVAAPADPRAEMTRLLDLLTARVRDDVLRAGLMTIAAELASLP